MKRWAVTGVCKVATQDGRTGLTCIREGFASRAEALAFIAEYRAMPRTTQYAKDLLPESYEGDHWQFKGGRCYMNARLTLLRDWKDLRSEFECYFGPVIAIGERDLQDETGAILRAEHAWIEVDDSVIDCGSFLIEPKCYAKKKYYDAWKVKIHRHETYAEVSNRIDKEIV